LYVHHHRAHGDRQTDIETGCSLLVRALTVSLPVALNYLPGGRGVGNIKDNKAKMFHPFLTTTFDSFIYSNVF
jgi:hypothetical protein